MGQKQNSFQYSKASDSTISIEEMQKKQAMDAAKNLLHLCKNRLQEQRSSFRTFGKTNGTEQQLLLDSSSSKSPAVGQTGVPNARRNQQALIHIHSVRMN